MRTLIIRVKSYNVAKYNIKLKTTFNVSIVLWTMFCLTPPRFIEVYVTDHVIVNQRYWFCICCCFFNIYFISYSKDPNNYICKIKNVWLTILFFIKRNFCIPKFKIRHTTRLSWLLHFKMHLSCSVVKSCHAREWILSIILSGIIRHDHDRRLVF